MAEAKKGRPGTRPVTTVSYRQEELQVIFKGLKFGMILQIAVGPICVFIFNIAATAGFIRAQFGVLAVVIIDALSLLSGLIIWQTPKGSN